MKLQLRKNTWTEKRDSIRLELECPVSYRTVSSKLGLIKRKSKPTSGKMLKPSMRGLRLLTSEAIPEGTPVHISVNLKRLGYDQSYEVHGQVVWTDQSSKAEGFEQGIALDKRGPDTAGWEEYIMDYLRRSGREWRGI